MGQLRERMVQDLKLTGYSPVTARIYCPRNPSPPSLESNDSPALRDIGSLAPHGIEE